MNAFMTKGTFDFLKNLKDKHPDLDLFYMNGDGSTLVYYESDQKKSIFASGRDFEAIIEKGQLKKKGYVVMNNIPVTDEGRAVFEENFRNRQQHVDSFAGFQAFRLLRPKKSNQYVVLTQWASKEDFEAWKNSDQFKKAHNKGNVKQPAYFADRPFITSYHMIDPNE
ncbi:antibiotic biosynthesis monooxygenase family protein [Virgibacillus siamensis]|uniref:antibiotic biosynthesis monooxygenase family protein n=1 Tax=Virgibacillus siamensis TaxID=480071 RepID=UPI0009853D50|nr:antibiotic biosynthesis monooxygenase [Virgibacillus siamensis]